MKQKEGLRNHHRLEETWETRQINAVWDPELDVGIKKKDINGKTGEFQIVCSLVVSYQC